MKGWVEFACAFMFFLGTHAIPSIPSLKARLLRCVGQAGYGALYGIVSILALGWLIVAAGRAPFVPLAAVAEWQLLAPFVLMLPACLLVAFALGRPNPYSFGGIRNDRFDPFHPGVVGLVRHPYLAALALWSLGHAIANPDAAHLILFGGFLILCLAGMVMIDRRKRLPRRRALPRPISADGKMTIPEWIARGVAALVLYSALLTLHPWFAGVSVRPYLERILP